MTYPAMGEQVSCRTAHNEHNNTLCVQRYWLTRFTPLVRTSVSHSPGFAGLMSSRVVQTRRMLIPGYALMYPAVQKAADDEIPGKDSNKPKDSKKDSKDSKPAH